MWRGSADLTEAHKYADRSAAWPLKPHVSGQECVVVSGGKTADPLNHSMPSGWGDLSGVGGGARHDFQE